MMLLLKENILNWDIPCLFKYNDFLNNFIREIVEVDEICPIKHISGGYNCKWNTDKNFADMDVHNIEIMNFSDIIPIFDFSNYNITDEDLKDKKSNIILDIILNCNGILEVSSDKLFDYIKKRYPYATILASAKKSIYEMEPNKESDFYNKILDKYDIVDMDPYYVKNKFINEHEKIYDHSRLRIIVNERKLKNCNNAQDYNKFLEGNNLYKKECIDNFNLEELYKNSLALSNEEIELITNITGVRNFKITDCNLSFPDTVTTIANYIFKSFGVSMVYAYFLIVERRYKNDIPF